MLEWILERLGLIIFVLIFVSQIIRGLMRARRDTPAPQAKPDELESARREREIQEEIRRRRAQRRAAEAAPERPPLAREEPPQVPASRRAETTQLPDPFEGPIRRVLEELQREIKPPPPTPPPLPPATVERRSAEIQRQEQLAEQMRALEEARAVAARRAAHLAEQRATEAHSEPVLRAAARDKLLEDLRNAESLRRAFVLREVLGTPVGLR